MYKLSTILASASYISVDGELIWDRWGESKKPTTKLLKQAKNVRIVCGIIPCSQSRYYYDFIYGLFHKEGKT